MTELFIGEGPTARLVGRLESDGTVYLGEAWSRETAGCVNQSDEVRRHPYDRDPVGQLMSDGDVVKGLSFSGQLVAHVDADGTVRAPGVDGRVLGRAVGDEPLRGGACLSLLFLDGDHERPATTARAALSAIVTSLIQEPQAMTPQDTVVGASPEARPAATAPGPSAPDPSLFEAAPSAAGSPGLLNRLRGKGPRRGGRFRVGDRVAVARIRFEGNATVIDVSRDWDRGAGTKLYPAFLVEFDDGRREWVNGVSLKPI
jgi:hypothetical protein